MILVISNIAIEAAPALVNLFPTGAASLVTASDFYTSFRAGISVNGFSSSALCINGKEIKPGDISGVITTVPCFLPVEFYYVDPADRQYVCTEVNSFFLYFLSELKCKKCNGPDWRMFVSGLTHKPELAKTAFKLGIPVQPFTIMNGYQEPADNKPDELKKCTIIYDKIIDAGGSEEMARYTRQLAGALSVPYLDCFFSLSNDKEYLLAQINTIPDISAPENRQAIANHFLNAAL